MNTVSGVVMGVYSKDVPSKFKPGQSSQVWDLRLDDDKYYKNGFKKPAIEVGDFVTIEYEDGQYGKTIKKLSSGVSAGAIPATVPQATASPQAFKPTGKVFPVPSDHGDRSIIRQNSLTNARELVTAYYKGHAISIEDEVDKIIEIAYKFEEYSSGDREVKAVDAMVNATKAPKPKKAQPKVVVEEDDAE